MGSPGLRMEGKYEKRICSAALQSRDETLARMKEKEKGAVA